MISVPNLRQPLSGNNILAGLSLAITITVLSSCSIFSHPRNTTSTKQDETKTEKDSTTVTQKEEEKKTEETTTEEKKKEKKDTYELAFVLPFSVDEAELNELLGDENITGYQPLASVEFYEGALLALDTLKKYGVNLNINVYDNKKDSLSTALLLNNPEFKSMDLVIGPVFNESLKAGAAFAKQNEIYMLSPLSPSSSITNDNPYYLMANATLQAQLIKTIQYIGTNHPKANFIVVYRSDKENETKMAAEFKTAFNQLKPDYPLIAMKEAYNFSGISAGMYTTDNFVFIASNEELFVNSLLRDLSKTSRENNITLIGLPSILTFESVSLDYFENLQLHYPTAYWADQNLSRVKHFNKTFMDKYNIKPSDYAYKGYDLTLYFGNMLKTYGPDLVSNIGKYNSIASSMIYQFDFQPCKAGEQLKFYENENITILKYEEYKFKKVN